MRPVPSYGGLQIGASIVGAFAILYYLGAVIGIGLMMARGADTRLPIPFGPFLALGAVCALFYGDALITWYLHLTLPA